MRESLIDVQLFALSAIGLALTGLGVWETFMAVLHPRATVGPITTTINRCFHFVVRTKVFRSSGLTVFSGPLLLVAHATCWATLLLFGVALIAWPQLGNGIIESGTETTDDSFLTAIYYSGFSITTLGVGDFVPRSGWTKLVTITSASLGFSFFTLVLAYVLSIYSALARRNQFACEIDYRTQRTGDTLAYLQPHILADDWTLLNQDLYSLASKLAELLESHHFYPALHYFQFSERRYAMSQMLRFCLEVATVLRAMRDTHDSTSAINREPNDRLWHASLQMLSDTEKHFVVCKSHDPPEEVGMANRLISQIQQADSSRWINNETAFVNHYVSMTKVWSLDLHSLELCMDGQIDAGLDD